MRNIFLLFGLLSFYILKANNPVFVKEVDCFEFANAVEGQDGDSGDFETWSKAFEHCANSKGFKTVIINN